LVARRHQSAPSIEAVSQKKSAGPKPRRFVVMFLPVAKAVRVRHKSIFPRRYSIA
jgi:hypothetical protein